MSDDYGILRFGDEQEPIVVIDDFATAHEALIQTASTQNFNVPPSHYPGIRAPASAKYLEERARIIEDILRNVFDITSGASLIECNYSMVTQAPDSLKPFQRFPHFDSVERGRIAVLHYLCGPQHGGTDFYRHKASGYETLNADRLPDYDALRQSEYETDIGKGYPGPHLRHFETIGSVSAKLNRMLIYRGRMLHSGAIPDDMTFSDNPQIGRLTLNTFLRGR